MQHVLMLLVVVMVHKGAAVGGRSCQEVLELCGRLMFQHSSAVVYSNGTSPAAWTCLCFEELVVVVVVVVVAVVCPGKHTRM